MRENASTNEVHQAIAEACDELKEMLIGKNRKYGNSALYPIRVFSKADPIEQLNVRIDDKLSRIASNQGDDNEDSEMDLAGYIVLKRVAQILKRKNEFRRDE